MRIGLIGEYKPGVLAHQALTLAAHDLGYTCEPEWVPTSQLEDDTAQQLASYQALWFVPNTPYASMAGALKGITWAREQRIPTLGTCGGCQHMLIEFARNVAGLHNADHAEEHPDAELLLITPLVCSNTNIVTTCLLASGSRVATIYGAPEVTEEYGTCNYGPNAQFWPNLQQYDMLISGKDPEGEARIIELPEHPFFIGTLFQPERSAFQQRVHPLIRALLQASLSETKE